MFQNAKIKSRFGQWLVDYKADYDDIIHIASWGIEICPPK